MKNITYTVAEKNEIVSEARAYLRGRGIRITGRMIEAQVASEHGNAAAAMIARFLGMTPTPLCAIRWIR